MIAILDIDGTLVDSNYFHAMSWFRAFRDHDITVPIWRIHQAQGKGGDQLVIAVTDQETEDRLGESLREAEGKHFMPTIDEIRPLDGARDLVVALKDAGHTVVLASSGKPEEVDHYIDLVGVRDIIDAFTNAEDVEKTKPDPELINRAVELGGGKASDAVLVGDTIWDFQAGEAAGVRGLAVLTGGFSAQELREAGAEEVFTSVPALREHLEREARG